MKKSERERLLRCALRDISTQEIDQAISVLYRTMSVLEYTKMGRKEREKQIAQVQTTLDQLEGIQFDVEEQKYADHVKLEGLDTCD